MDLTKEALQFLTAERPIQFHVDDTRRYSDRELHPVQCPVISALKVCTLTGLVGLITERFESVDLEETLIHVETFDRVAWLGKNSDGWNRRPFLASAEPLKVPGFSFGNFMDPERFIIGLQTNFLPTPELTDLVRLASNITASRVVTSEDDGISQTVGQKTGVVLKTQDKVPGRVKLVPHRTFPEATQPVSEFVLRVNQKDENTVPFLALHEADGGAWKVAAMMNVGSFLRTALDKNIHTSKVPVIW